MVTPHIHLWPFNILCKAPADAGFQFNSVSYFPGKEDIFFKEANKVFASMKYQVFIKTVYLLQKVYPGWRGYYFCSFQKRL